MKGLGNAQIFARNLRHYVEQSGQLGKDIATAIGVAPTTFSEWANGKKYPRIDKIEMLANYFHIQKSDLIEDHSVDGTISEPAPQLPGAEKLLSLAHAYPDMSPQMRAYVDGSLDLLFKLLEDQFKKGSSADDSKL